ncbi:hypothetical protein HPS12939_0264, partial [Glaesserella parasuis 12939]
MKLTKMFIFMVNDTLSKEILTHAKRSEPHESCGFVVSKGG